MQQKLFQKFFITSCWSFQKCHRKGKPQKPRPKLNIYIYIYTFTLNIYKEYLNSNFKSYLVHFLSPSPKNKKINPPKKFLTFQKMGLSSSCIKKFLIFFIFQETRIPKTFFMFQKTETLKSFSYFIKCNFPSPKNNKKNLYY